MTPFRGRNSSSSSFQFEAHLFINLVLKRKKRLFFVPPSVRLGHRALASELLRAVAEACSPQRFPEENAVCCEIYLTLLITLLSLETSCIRLYSSIPGTAAASVTSATPRACPDPRIYRSSCYSPLVEKSNEIQRCWRFVRAFKLVPR